MIEGYVESIFSKIVKGELDKEKIVEQFLHKFKRLSGDMCKTERWKTACHIVTKNANLA